MAELNWSDAQSHTVKGCGTEAFERASASVFFSVYEPLSDGAKIVCSERLTGAIPRHSPQSRLTAIPGSQLGACEPDRELT
jgi:hypothetical protein